MASPKTFGAAAHLVTIANCKAQISQVDAIDRIKSFVPPYKTLSIACERHGKGDLHYHVLWIGQKKWTFTKARWAPIRAYFDAANDDYKTWSRKTGITSNEWRVEKWRYCNNLVNKSFSQSKGEKKGQLWVHNEGVALSDENVACEQDLKQDPQILKYFSEGKTLLDQYQAADWTRKAYIAKNWDILRKMINSHKTILREIKGLVKKFTSDDFDRDAVRSVNDVDLKLKALVISGAPGFGKTQLAKTIFKRPLLVRHPDKLKQLDENLHDGIIFDDQAYAHWPRESVIHLMDLEEETDINVKNSMVTIPAGFPRVFCTNRYHTNIDGGINLRVFKHDQDGSLSIDKDKSFLPAKLRPGDNAIDRRIVHIHFHSDIRKIAPTPEIKILVE